MNRVALHTDSEKFKSIGKRTELSFLSVLENGEMVDVNHIASQWIELFSSRKRSYKIQYIPDRQFVGMGLHMDHPNPVSSVLICFKLVVSAIHFI